MYRVLIAMACVLVAGDTTWAARRERCRPTACCRPKCCTASANCSPTRCTKPYVDPCYCLLEPIATYPVSGGGTETMYLGEKHDEGCAPVGYCNAPLTVYLTHPQANKPSQDCSVPNECSLARKAPPRCLREPVLADYEPRFVGNLEDVATIIKSDYLVFDSGPKGQIRAKVFLVELPRDDVIRPNQPHRIVAIGYEVEEVAESEPTYPVDRKYVRLCEKNPCLYCVTVGGVTYGIVTAR